VTSLARSPRNAGGLVLLVGALLLVPLLALVATAFVTFDTAALLHLARTVLAETVMVSGILAAGTLAGTLLLGVSCAWCI
jgi:ABC-type Fe3+ transport system permease subunit